MACALLQGASFLLLDEPTNHLDIQSKEILLTALKEYAGTILFVSHDHYFVQELATSIVELSETGALSYPGTYEEYLDQRRVQVQAHEPAHGVLIQQKKFIQNASVRKVHDELAKLERKIQKLERERTQLHKQFETLIYGTPEFTQATEKLQHTEKMLEQLIQEWEKRYTV
jgi:ATP-binding cassette subfamily F protein 3